VSVAAVSLERPVRCRASKVGREVEKALHFGAVETAGRRRIRPRHLGVGV